VVPLPDRTPPINWISSLYHVEAFTCAKNPASPESNEDRIVAIPGRLYAVIDGATDIGGLRYDDRSGRQAAGGRLAAEAVAEALAIDDAGSFTHLPDPQRLVADLSAAIGAVYARLDLPTDEILSGHQRFRAAFSAALIAGETLMLVALGDCTIRLNGQAVLTLAFPGDAVLSRARAVGWSILEERGMPADAIRPLARQSIVQGPASQQPLPAGFRPDDVEAICAAVHADPEVQTACGDRAMIDSLLRAGLRGVRVDPERFDAVTLNGVGNPADKVRTLQIPLADVDALEIASDGYPVLPEQMEIATWERALAEVDATDPDRIGSYAGTTGRTATTFGDDRSILIASRKFSSCPQPRRARKPLSCKA
jgi:hypothetical protein